MTLKKYHQKRNFKNTTEPLGKIKASKSKKMYLIQKHSASHLHYDLRLELNGVLLSWAIPKGPSLDPTVKRLAVHVEDHPLEYGSFEGMIPEGEYGGGTVMLWDQGEWNPKDSNTKQAYQQGNLTFQLKGKRLKGLWKLIRIQKNPKNWLLIKIDDKYAQSEKKYNITEAETTSVASKKTMDQIKKNANKPKKSTTPTRILPELATLSSELSHPDKIIFPKAGITKRKLSEYYLNVNEWMLPYLAKRPLTLLRCPHGQGKQCFYQKHLRENESEFLYSVGIKDKKSIENYSYVKDVRGLIALVQLGVLEIHSWNSHIDKPEYPDMIIFDLDPAPNVAWKTVVHSAFFVRDQLEKLDLKSYVKTTGGKGLHIIVPIKRKYTWDDVKLFSRAFADNLVAMKPNEYIATMSKTKRTGKIFIDYLRNQHGASSVAPYSTRINDNASVATPLHWDELTTKIKPDGFTVRNLPKRLVKLNNDPWEGLLDISQGINLKLVREYL